MQRMNMLYSDLYNVLLLLFIILAIGCLIFHLRRLIFLWTDYKKNKEEISKTKSQCLDLKRKNCLLQEEIKSLRTELVTSSQEAAEAGKFIEEHMKSLSNENASYHSQITNNAEKIQKLAYTIQEQENVKNSLSNNLRAAHEKVAAAEEEISKTKSQYLDLERKNCLQQEENESLRTKLGTFSQEAAEAGKFIEEHMKRLSNENASYHSQITNNAEKIQKLAYIIQEQENVKNSLRNNLRAAHEKLAAAEEEISKTKSQCLDLERKNCLQQEENESLRTKLGTFSQEAAEAGKFIEEHMKRLSNENASYHSQITNNAEKIQKLAYIIQEQENVKNSLSNNLRAAHEKLAAAEEEISKTKSQCLDLERKNGLQQEENESLRTKLGTFSHEAAEAGKFIEEHMKRLSNENASYHSQITNNAEKIQKLAYIIQEQENVKNSLSNNLRAAHEKLAAAEEEISKTKSQCLDLERKNCLQQEENESLITKLGTFSHEAAEAGKFIEEHMKRLRNENISYRRQIANNAEKIQKLTITIQEQENVKNSLSNCLRAAHEKLAAAEDRVMYKSRQAGDITVLRYSSCPAMRMSDHKPVFGVFDVRVRPGGDNFALAPGQFNSQVYTEALKRRSRAGQARNTTVPAT